MALLYRFWLRTDTKVSSRLRDRGQLDACGYLRFSDENQSAASVLWCCCRFVPRRGGRQVAGPHGGGLLPLTRINFAMVAGMSMSTGLIFFFIVALDHPFAGGASVEPEPLKELLAEFDALEAGAQK
jgi:hypothetical protein